MRIVTVKDNKDSTVGVSRNDSKGNANDPDLARWAIVHLVDYIKSDECANAVLKALSIDGPIYGKSFEKEMDKNGL